MHPSGQNPSVADHPSVAQYEQGNPVVSHHSSGRAVQGRPWLGVRFTCAGAYIRVYRQPDGSRYIARCPRCGRSAIFRVGPDGTGSRQFEISCQ